MIETIIQKIQHLSQMLKPILTSILSGSNTIGIEIAQNLRINPLRISNFVQVTIETFKLVRLCFLLIFKDLKDGILNTYY